MSKPFSLSTATSLTSTGTKDIVVDATSESLPNAADASPKNGQVFTLQFPKKKKGPGNMWVSTAQAQAKGDFRQGKIFLSVNSVDLIVLPALIGSFIFAEGILFSC
jgi:hypothetical protein